jgi:thiosulfate/3-mercaptopyruvate sulfurtransferase
MESMSSLRIKNFGYVLAISVLMVILHASACSRQAYQESAITTSDPWGPDRLIQPEELMEILSRPSTGKPLLLHTGVPDLYRRAHIGGSRFVGMAADAEGIQKLKNEVQQLPLETEIIIYCGCCPWDHCPNIRPAFQTLVELGFKNVKILYLPHNLQQDWVEKGFPIEKGASIVHQKRD